MAVLRLRRLLRHDDVLRVEGGHLWLDRTRVWVDAWAFLCDESVAYAGTFLDGETQHEAVEGLRRRLRALLIQRSQQRGDVLEASGRSAQALSVYEAALLHDDLAEVLHRGVIRCHLALGEPAAAMRAFQRCRACLEQGLGVPPAPATQALVRELGATGKAPIK